MTQRIQDRVEKILGKQHVALIDAASGDLHEANLLRESLGGDGPRELGVEHFHDDVASELLVACNEHARHPTAGEAALERVGAAEACLDFVTKLGVHNATSNRNAGQQILR